MSVLLQCIDLCYSRPHKPLFDKINVSIHDGDRIGLVGHNGSGKSTLLHLLAGIETPDAGEIRTVRQLRVALVEQFVPETLNTLSLLDAALIDLSEEHRWSEGYQAEAMLQQLGFTIAQFATPVSGLSGGEQNLLLIARALLKGPQLLLMDEPGNHLDIQAMHQLQQVLAETRVPWLMVSHDRALLNAVCRRTVFLRDTCLYAFDLPYDQAKMELKHRDEAAERTRSQEEREIERLQASAKRLAMWGRDYDNEDLARKAKSMEKRIDKLEADRTPISRGSGLHLSLASRALAGNQVLYVLDSRKFSVLGLASIQPFSIGKVQPPAPSKHPAKVSPFTAPRKLRTISLAISGKSLSLGQSPHMKWETSQKSYTNLYDGTTTTRRFACLPTSIIPCTPFARSLPVMQPG